jgi:hypothetical protein
MRSGCDHRDRLPKHCYSDVRDVDRDIDRLCHRASFRDGSDVRRLHARAH